MNTLDIILIIIIIICILIIIFNSLYTRFQISIIKINEASANIESSLRKKFDLLNKSINVIKNNTDEKKILENIKKSRSKRLDMFEFDNELSIGLQELNGYIEKYPDLKNNEQYMNINFGLAETESELNAFKKYYKDIVLEYNRMLKKFPTNLVGLLSGQKKKQTFEKKKTTE